MNWTLPHILEDVALAWAPANLPYTLGFWLIVGLGVWALNRRNASDDSDDA